MGIRTLLSRTFAALAVTFAVGLSVLLGASAAMAAAEFVEVNPSSVQAGNRVDVRASCGNNTNQARVESDAFGQVFLRPDNSGMLTGTVTVPANRAAGTYNVLLTCADGSTASTTLNVLSMARPTQGPATGAGGTASGMDGRTVLIGGLATVGIGGGLAMLAARRRRPGVRT